MTIFRPAFRAAWKNAGSLCVVILAAFSITASTALLFGRVTDASSSLKRANENLNLDIHKYDLSLHSAPTVDIAVTSLSEIIIKRADARVAFIVQVLRTTVIALRKPQHTAHQSLLYCSLHPVL